MHIEKRRLVLSIIMGIIFSVFFIIGSQLNFNSEITFDIFTALYLLIGATILTIAFYKISNLKISFKQDKKYELKWLKIFVPLMLISIVLLLAIYPGNFGYDSMAQYYIYASGEYGTHFPAIFCFILGAFLDLGKNIFGNFEAGLAMYLLVQSIFINFTISKIIEYVVNKLKNKKFTILFLLFFVLHPLSQILILSTCHDVFFSGFFALLTLEFLKMSEEKDYFTKKSNFIKVGSITVLMCLFRNNGFFALLPAIIIGFIVLKNYRKKFLIMLAIPMVIFQGWNQIFTRFISTDNQSLFHESLNIPVMQIARSLYYNHSKVWSEELNLYFNEYCGWTGYRIYTGISDNFKFCLKDEYIESHLLDFIGFWAKTGLKAPHRYIEAPGILSLGLYYPWKTYPYNPHATANIYHPYIEYVVYDGTGVYPIAAPLHRRSKIPFLDNFFKDFIDNNGWSSVFGFRFIWCGAFTTFLLLFCIFLIFISKKYHLLAPIGLIFGLTLTIILAPTVIFRFIFPIVLTVPIMIYILVSCIRKNKI